MSQYEARQGGGTEAIELTVVHFAYLEKRLKYFNIEYRRKVQAIGDLTLAEGKYHM